MDYSKMGAPKLSKNAPKHDEARAKGAGRSKTGGRASKEELVARMKAAAEAKKTAE